MADKILLENGVDRLLLEDGTSFLLLEGGTATVVLRHPTVSIQQRKRYVAPTHVVNLLQNTLGTLPTITGTIARTNQNDTSAISGSPIVNGSLNRTNADDTMSAQGTTAVSGTIAVTTSNDTSSASGSPIVNGTINVSEAVDTMAASGTVDTTARPFVPVVFDTVQRRNINVIVYGSRGVNPQPPVTPSAPIKPDVFVVAQRKPNRFTSFDFPNLLTTLFEPKQIASSYPEHVKILRKQNVYFDVFPNLIVRVPAQEVSGTITYTNANDTSAATGSTTVLGTISTTNQDDTIVASGDVGNNIIGTISYTNNNDTVVATGSPIVNGTIAYTENFDVSNISGSPVVVGSINITNNNDNMSASGIVGPIIAGAGTKLPLTGVGT